MGVSRLLAKGWAVFCLLAGLYALAHALGPGGVAPAAAARIGATVLLFAAMGLLFLAGLGLATGSGPFWRRLIPRHAVPGFNEMVYLVFALASFAAQTFVVPATLPPLAALRDAVRFAVPGQAMLAQALGPCQLSGNLLLANSFAWLLAFIFLGSSLSRMRLAAGILRLERKDRPEALTEGGAALLMGAALLFFLQLIYLGTAYPQIPCAVWSGIGGDLLIGQAPLMLAYLALAAMTNLIATADEA